MNILMEKPRQVVSEFLTCRVGGQNFCIDVTSIKEIRGWSACTTLPHAPDYVLGVINLRGVVLPVVDLSLRLGFPRCLPDSRHVIVVVEVGSKLVGLLVNEVSNIFAISGEEMQPTPDIANESVRAFIRGVFSIEDTMVSLVELANLVGQAKELANK